MTKREFLDKYLLKNPRYMEALRAIENITPDEPVKRTEDITDYEHEVFLRAWHDVSTPKKEMLQQKIDAEEKLD